MEVVLEPSARLLSVLWPHDCSDAGRIAALRTPHAAPSPPLRTQIPLPLCPQLQPRPQRRERKRATKRMREAPEAVTPTPPFTTAHRLSERSNASASCAPHAPHGPPTRRPPHWRIEEEMTVGGSTMREWKGRDGGIDVRQRADDILFRSRRVAANKSDDTGPSRVPRKGGASTSPRR